MQNKKKGETSLSEKNNNNNTFRILMDNYKLSSQLIIFSWLMEGIFPYVRCKWLFYSQ